MECLCERVARVVRGQATNMLTLRHTSDDLLREQQEHHQAALHYLLFLFINLSSHTPFLPFKGGGGGVGNGA